MTENHTGPTDDSLLDVRGLTVTYSRQRHSSVVAANDITFSVQAGECFGLVGESGSGKSSVARALMRLADAEGDIVFDGHAWLELSGKQLRRQRSLMQMVFQDPMASLDPRMSIRALTAEPLEINRWGTVAERRARADELLSLVGLTSDQARRRPSELSGGQRQRVAIARALAPHPKLVVLDEPVSALDASVRAQVLNLLASLRAELGLAYLFITHDLIVAEYLCDRLAVMRSGQIMEIGDCQSIFEAPTHPYTQELLSAVPIPDPNYRRKSTRTMASKAPSDVHSGCPIHSQCIYGAGKEKCATESPPMTKLAEDHFVACHFVDLLTGTQAAAPMADS